MPAEPFSSTGCQNPLWICCLPNHNCCSAGFTWWAQLDFWFALNENTEVFLMQRLVGCIQLCALKWVKSTSNFSTYILVAWIVHSPNSHRSSECVPGFCCPCFTWQLLSSSRCFLHQHHFLLGLKAVNLYGLQLFRDIRGQSQARTDSKSLNTQKAAFRYTS